MEGRWAKTKKKPTNFKAVFNQESLDPPAPVRPRITEFYPRRCYQERIKPRFEARWAVISKQEQPPAAVTVRNAVTKEAWAAESVPFQTELKAALEAEHAAAVAAHKTLVAGSTPTSPEEYHVAVNNAGFYLQPFVEVVAERFGMNVSLLMCGPTPDRGGAIEVHSVHTGVSKGLVPRIWPDFDRAGFEGMCRSFPSEEKRAGSLGGIAELPHDNDAAGGSGFGSRTANDMDVEDAPPPVPSREGDREEGDRGAGESDKSEREEDDDDEEEGRDLAEAMSPELAAEVERMEPAAHEAFKARAGILGATQSDTSRAAEGGDKQGGAKTKKLRKKKAKEATAGTRRSTRGLGAEDQREDGDGDEEDDNVRETETEREAGGSSASGARPRPRPVYKGALLPADVPLVRPEDDATSLGPLGEVAMAPLVRPEEDPSSLGPMRDGNVVALMPPVRPEQDSGAHVGEVAMAPLVRPEEDLSSLGPMRDVNPVAQTLEAALTPPVRPEQDGAAHVEDGAPEGGRSSSRDGEALWGGEDLEQWTPELPSAVKGLVCLEVWGGAEWVGCVKKLVALEGAWGFKDKGMLSAPTDGRGGHPKVVKEWMRYARRWGKKPGSKTPLPDGTLMRPNLVASDWEGVAKTSGRNGMLLFVGCLLWWGEAAAEREDVSLTADWRDAVSDVSWVLSEVGKGVGALVKAVEKADKEAAKTAMKSSKGGGTGTKRKVVEKENEVEESARYSTVHGGGRVDLGAEMEKHKDVAEKEGPTWDAQRGNACDGPTSEAQSSTRARAPLWQCDLWARAPWRAFREHRGEGRGGQQKRAYDTLGIYVGRSGNRGGGRVVHFVGAAGCMSSKIAPPLMLRDVREEIGEGRVVGVNVNTVGGRSGCRSGGVAVGD
ncbi:hypothetical protein B0H16DRAFT_1477680 [Mycena metata]|uniref:Uncharacterized protein n=1 Tax=Mycena metata TaxID=1033252 RepID=A0AAD7H9F6_9AGAR|nr:hypothetical protein B0H16DRAFT_1477680 [Mycena metata]